MEEVAEAAEVVKMGRNFRVAQCNLICEIGGCKIPVGHPYTWVQRKHKNSKGNEIVKILRVCPKCAEAEEKAGDGHEKQNKP